MKIIVLSLLIGLVLGVIPPTIFAQDSVKTITVTGVKPILNIDSILKLMPGYKPPKKIQYDGNPIHTRFVDTTEWWTVSCEVVSLPQIHKSFKAVVTIESLVDGNEWPMNVNSDSLRLRVRAHGITGKSVNPWDVFWPGPIASGDTFQFEIELLQNESGRVVLTIDHLTMFRVTCGRSSERILNVEWCLDETGRLMHLQDSRTVGLDKTIPLRTFLFDKDSMSIPLQFTRRAKIGGWEFPRLVVEPPFHLGDTSRVTYYLTSREKFPRGIHFDISTVHMKVVNFPDRINYSIDSGQTIEISLDVVPAVVQNLQHLSLRVEQSYRMRIWTLFDEDGWIRSIVNRPYGYSVAEYLPTNFPEAEDTGIWQSEWIVKDRPHPYPDRIKH